MSESESAALDAAPGRHGKRGAVDRGAIDLDRMTVPELAALIEAAEAKRREKMDAAKAALQAEFRDKATQLGLPLDAFLPAPPAPLPTRKRRASGDKLAVKYKGPHGEEWSGRGRLPNWLQALVAGGRNKDDFLIKG